MSRRSETSRGDSIDAALDAFARGEPVCIHDADDREGETDFIYPAGAVTPAAVARLRNDAGGLVCVAVSHAVAETFALPFLQETLDHPAAAEHNLVYDDRSSFSLSVNHRETETGITDEELSELTELLEPHVRSEDGRDVKIEPAVVFEVGYEEIQRSPTTASGYALRFPRFLGVRADLDPDGADSLDRIERLADESD